MKPIVDHNYMCAMQIERIFDEVIEYTGPQAYMHVSLVSRQARNVYENRYSVGTVTLVPLRNSDLHLFNYMVTKCWLLLDSVGYKNSPRMQLAVMSGNIDYIKTYCSNSGIPDLGYLIDVAARENQEDMVKYLWSRREFSFEGWNNKIFGTHVIQEFTRHSNYEMVQWACNWYFYITDEAIEFAIHNGNLPMAKFLLSRIHPRELSFELINVLVVLASDFLEDICATMPHILAPFPDSGGIAAAICLPLNRRLFYAIRDLYKGYGELLFFERLHRFTTLICENNKNYYRMNLLKELYPDRVIIV